MPRRPVRKTVDLKPVLIVFLVAFLVLGFGAFSALPLVYVLVAFFVILLVAFLVLVRSIMRR